MKEIKNPFIKMLDDQKRIKNAIQHGIPLSSLSDIEFVHPINLKKNKKMGVKLTQYFFIGLKLDPKKYAEKLCTEELYDNDYKIDDYLTIIYDGMLGEYLYLGHIVEEKDEYRDLNFFNNGLIKTIKEFENEIEKIKKLVSDFLLPEDFKLINEVDAFYIKHYS